MGVRRYEITHRTVYQLLRRRHQFLRPRIPHPARLAAAALPVPRAGDRPRGGRQLDQPRRIRQPQLVLPRHRAPPQPQCHQPLDRRGRPAAAGLYEGASAAAPWEIARPVGPDGALAVEFTLDLQPPEITDEVRDYAAPSFTPGRPLIEVLRDLNARIHTDFTYRSGSTTVSTQVERGFGRARRGMSGLRAARDRLPARQRSGRELRVGLSGDRPAAGKGTHGRHRRDARLGVGVDAAETCGWAWIRPTTRWSTSAT